MVTPPNMDLLMEQVFNALGSPIRNKYIGANPLIPNINAPPVIYNFLKIVVCV